MNRDARNEFGETSGDDTEEDDDDDDDEALGRPSSVLWESYIEQRIIVDISDDDSLHFSYSQDSHSPQHTDSGQLTDSSETEEGSSASDDSAHSKFKGNMRTKNPKENQSAGDKPAIKSPDADDDADAGNTSDEGQEDLPYDGAAGCKESQAGPSPAHITDVLLRHFSPEELLSSRKLIDAETLPEMSLLESVDETVQSRVSRTRRRSMGEMEKNLVGTEEPKEVNECPISANSDVESPADDADKEQRPELYCSASHWDPSRDLQKTNASFLKTRTYSEQKYGQGKVHYPLPDFSKVSPKVKIPKGVVSASSPGLLCKPSSAKATAEVISRVLEDTIISPEKDNQSALARQIQADYDRLLAKYQDTDKQICQIFHCPSETSAYIDQRDSANDGDDTNLTTKAMQTAERDAVHKQLSPSQPLPDSQSLSDGERLTSDLSDIISSFTQKVDEFKNCVVSMSMNVEEQHMVLKGMMEAQDQLQRNYLMKKEEHRALEMQNFRGLARNTGAFDPDRAVEGKIFRIGMQLEDIKEQIDSHRFLSSLASSIPSPSPCEDILLSASHPPLREVSSVSSAMVEETEAVEGLGSGRDIVSGSGRFSTASSEEDEGIWAAAGDEDQLTETTLHSLEVNIGHCEDSYLSVREQSPRPNKDETQVCQETDSGFGSSVLCQPINDLFQSSRNTVSSSHSEDAEVSPLNEETSTSIENLKPCPLIKHAMDLQSNYISQSASALHPTPPAEGVRSTLDPATRRKDVQMHPDKDTHSHCLCHNGEVILALQYEVSRLKRALEENLPQIRKRTEIPSSGHKAERNLSTTRAESSRFVKTSSGGEGIEDWISSDLEPSRVTDKESDPSLSFLNPSHGPRGLTRSGTRARDSRNWSRSSSDLQTFKRSANSEPITVLTRHRTSQRNGFSNRENHLSRKHLLQVNYASSSSLPPGFKVQDPESDPGVSSRGRSTQSDSALLPSNVFFQKVKTSPQPRVRRSRRRTSREESIHKSLDKALHAAFLMKQTTEKMADALTADLAKAQLHRKSRGLQFRS